MYKVVKNAHVLTLDGKGTEHECADILINGSKIEAIGEKLELPTDAEVIDAQDMLAMPGLINAHFHSPSAFIKGALEGMHLEPYMLLEWPGAEHWETERMYYLRAMLTAMDMLKIGITSVRDDAHFWSHPNDAMIDGIFNAFRDAGMRASIALGIPNVSEIDKLPFLRETISESVVQQLSIWQPKETDELLALYQSVTDRWHQAANGRMTVHGSVSAPQRVTGEYFQALNAFCVENDMSLDVHTHETKTQRVHADVVHGHSFVKYMRELEVLNENTVLIHCVWVDDEDMDLIAGSGSVVAHNPVSNLRLGSGVMPFNAMAARGIPVCLGTDEPSVEDTSNLWVVAKTGALLQKITDPDSDHWPIAGQYIDTMCAGGARAMRQPDHLGSLEVGKEADLILLDLDSLSFTPRNDLRKHLVFCENGSSVKLTMVAGEVVNRNGTLLNVDEDAIKAEINEFWPDYRRDCDLSNDRNRDLLDFYGKIADRCVAVDVGFNRWINFDSST